jgi:cell division protein FtsI (penicillin-binding protein 3)
MAEHSEPRSWRQTAGPRLLIVGVLLSVWAVAVFVRLVDLQILQHEALEAKGKRQQTSTVLVPAQRGDIVDRHGTPLAYTVEEDTLAVDPRELEDRRQAVVRLCGALGDCTADERIKLETTLSQSARGFEVIRDWVSEEQARRVAALEKTPSVGPKKKPGVRMEPMPGVILKKKPRRYYPNKELAASVLGFVGDESKALAGLELRYDDLLSGQPAKILVQKDGKRDQFSRVGPPPVPGATIELTIDAVLQAVVERELRAGVEENRALGGAVVVMVPATGEILAMASEPTFEPNAFNLGPAENRINRAVQSPYEPGSTFKIVTGSAALEEKVMRPTDLIDTGNGTITIGSRRPITEAQGHRYGTLSFEDVIVKSSNVGAVKIGLRLGGELLGRFVDRFGFGTKLSPDFSNGESRGRVPRSSNWTDSTLASVAMGYEVSVTPLQMAAAASAVANGGDLVQPRVVRAVIHGDRRLPVPRKVIRRAISPETAFEMTSIMEGVVDHGTATRAKLTDFIVAGKTGTASKIVDGQYARHDVNASFVGFVPSRQPAVTILVVIDSPHGPNPPFGGTVAAPIFRRIADAALRYLGVAPTINPTPPVLLARSGAGATAPTSGFAVPVTIVPALASAAAGQIVLPELRGLSLREAVRILMRLGVTPRVAGEGVVIEQNPLPGSPVEPGGACRLALGRLAPGVHP